MISDSVAQQDPAGELSEIALDSLLGAAAAASVAYWIILFSQVAAIFWYPLALLLLVAVALVAVGAGYKIRRIGVSPPLKLLLVVCMATALVNIFTNRPDADDFNFFQRALVSASNIWQPIDLNNTGFDLSGLPPITPTHLMTSYEVTTAYLVKLIGIPPMTFFHYGVGSLMAFVMPLAFYLSVRLFGYRPLPGAVGAIGAIVFLLFSGDYHRDWGNFTLTRIWQGKCLIVALHIPLMWLYSLRFSRYGCRFDLARVVALTIAGIGLTGSALFLLPWVAAAASCGSVIAERFSWEQMRRGLLTLGSVVSVTAILSLMAFGLGPAPTDTSVWQQGWPQNAVEALGFVLPPSLYPVYFMIALVGLGLAPNRQAAFSVFLGIAGSAVLLFFPWSSQILVKTVTPGAFWRLLYTFPLPLCFGLLFAGALTALAERAISGKLKATVAFSLLAVFLTQKATIFCGVLALPAAVKFDALSLARAQTLANELPQSAVVLAPEAAVIPLGLLRPDLRFISTRGPETLHVFNNAGRSAEGQQRLAWQVAVSSCAATAPTVEPIKVDAIIFDGSCSSREFNAPAWLAMLPGSPLVFKASGEPVDRGF